MVIRFCFVFAWRTTFMLIVHSCFSACKFREGAGVRDGAMLGTNGRMHSRCT